MSKQTESNNGQTNIVAAGTTITGDITTTGDLRLDGHIEGTIQSTARLVIGKQGSFSGNIVAENVDITGKVNGNISAKDTLLIKADGEVTGDINTNTLIIEQHAVFNGSCSMGNQAKDAVSSKKEK
ncbi:MAG: polymer-forming cytoskeletal protein [Paludibacteraceae bacterium]|nr:polymer-forming cytoskeletal protein [Paludibacteraceae bacterium]